MHKYLVIHQHHCEGCATEKEVIILLRRLAKERADADQEPMNTFQWVAEWMVDIYEKVGSKELKLCNEKFVNWGQPVPEQDQELADRIAALGFPPDTSVYRLTIEDTMSVLEDEMQSREEDVASLSDADLKGAIDAINKGFGCFDWNIYGEDALDLFLEQRKQKETGGNV